MNFFQGLILGVVQGLTEFLPVSSSAHLTIFSALLKIPENIAFFVFLHLATLLAAVAYFRRDISEIIKSVSKVFGGQKPADLYRSDEHFKLFCFLILGCIPTGIIGYFFNDFFEAAFGSLMMIGVFLIITGIILWLTDLLGTVPVRGLSPQEAERRLSPLVALIVGTAQGIAILPGISRSGATVAAALFSGINRELAVRFSFLLSIPAILGAAVFEAKKITGLSLTENVLNPSGWLGFLVSFASGYLAISFFIKLINRQKLHYFSIYCFIVGALLIFC